MAQILWERERERERDLALSDPQGSNPVWEREGESKIWH